METFRFQFNLVATNFVVLAVSECEPECSLWSEEEMANFAMVHRKGISSQRGNHAFKDAVVLIFIAGKRKNALTYWVCATRHSNVEFGLRTNQNARCITVHMGTRKGRINPICPETKSFEGAEMILPELSWSSPKKDDD